jgi:hypothetical protein
MVAFPGINRTIRESIRWSRPHYRCKRSRCTIKENLVLSILRSGLAPPVLAGVSAFLAFGTVTAAPRAAWLIATMGRISHDSSDV